MLDLLKSLLYFPIANYFRFFAEIRLNRWHPRIIVVTGSNGKTTLLHLIESQLKDVAHFSHHANSSFGIPFDILGLHRKTMRQSEWISLFVNAPRQAFTKPPKQKIYVVEADCDRPNEGKFLASLLKPEVVLWISISGTHGMNFDSLIAQKKFSTVKEAIAYEYGYFLEYCKKLAVINGDSVLQTHQTGRSNAKIKAVKTAESLKKYKIDQKNTSYTIDNQVYEFPAVLPEEIFYSIAMCRAAVEYFDLSFDSKFTNFTLPPGRSSVFDGIKDTILIDSSYNANLSSILAVLSMYQQMPNKKKWVVLGDMLELGKSEQQEHEQLAESLASLSLARIILIGPRNQRYTYPKIKELKTEVDVVAFQSAKDALDDITAQVQGGETILFKGSQSLLLEGVIEPLLAKKSDAQYLPRRGAFWDNLRAKRGL